MKVDVSRAYFNTFVLDYLIEAPLQLFLLLFFTLTSVVVFLLTSVIIFLPIWASLLLLGVPKNVISGLIVVGAVIIYIIVLKDRKEVNEG